MPSFRKTIIVTALLSVTLSGKIFSKVSAVAPDPDAVATQLADFFRANGFNVGEVQSQIFLPVTKGECQALVADIAPQGWQRNIVFAAAPLESKVSFFFRGQFYSDQPRWATWGHHYWGKLWRLAGGEYPISPVLAIIATPTCNLDEIQWISFVERMVAQAPAQGKPIQ